MRHSFCHTVALRHTCGHTFVFSSRHAPRAAAVAAAANLISMCRINVLLLPGVGQDATLLLLLLLLQGRCLLLLCQR
jgi:hypothetical protein